MSSVSKKKPRIAWFIPEPRWMNLRRIFGQTAWEPNVALGSVWIRSYQLAPYLREKEYQTTFNNLDPPPDVAIFLRRYNAEDVELAKSLKGSGVKIILDVVVNYFQERLNTIQGYGGSSKEQVNNFLGLADIADQVWTGSPFLREIAAEFNPNTYFISDSIDPVHFHCRAKLEIRNNQPLVLGWSGVSVKANALETLAPILIPLISNQQVRISIISDKPPKLSFNYDFTYWRYSTFPMEIIKCDLCIAPRIVNDDYDRGHSLFKIGVFMSMGIPALAGPIPSYELLLGDGLAGHICESQIEWRYQLNRFLSEPELRTAMSDEAIIKIRPYLTTAVCTEIDYLLKKLMT